MTPREPPPVEAGRLQSPRERRSGRGVAGRPEPPRRGGRLRGPCRASPALGRSPVHAGAPCALVAQVLRAEGRIGCREAPRLPSGGRLGGVGGGGDPAPDPRLDDGERLPWR